MGMFDDDGFDSTDARAYDPDNPGFLVPRHGDPRKGWPKIRRLEEPTKYRFHQRASQLGDPLDDSYALHWWELRAAVRGMALVPELAPVALSVINPTVKGPAPANLSDEEWERERKEARAVLGDVVVRALHAAGCERRAAQGTILHRLFPRYLRGDDLGPIDELYRAALAKMGELVAGFTLHASEMFTVWDDVDNPNEFTQVRAAGSLDGLASPPPGCAMTTPDGTLITEHDRCVVDWKSGGNDVRKLGYGCQAPPYVLGRPYDHTVTDEQARDGDDGRRDWPDGIRPHQRWALLMHIPLERLDDAAWVWVDISRGVYWARAATAMRSTLTEARAGAKEMFHAAELPVPVADVRPLPTKAAPAPTGEPVLASVTPLDLPVRVERAPSLAAINTLYEAHAAEWSDEVRAAARRARTRIEGAPA